jgi:hypothetical protein
MKNKFRLYDQNKPTLPPMFKELYPGAKARHGVALPPEMITKIKILQCEGFSNRQIAKELHISPPTVAKYLRLKDYPKPTSPMFETPEQLLGELEKFIYFTGTQADGGLRAHIGRAALEMFHISRRKPYIYNTDITL